MRSGGPFLANLGPTPATPYNAEQANTGDDHTQEGRAEAVAQGH